MPKDEAEKMLPIFMKIAKNKKPFYNLENINIHKNGRKVILETSGVPIIDEKENLIGYRGIDRDITERKHAEEKLTKNERLLAQTQQVAGIGSWEWNLETKKVTFSDELYHLYGIDKTKFNLTVDTFLGIIHPQDREVVAKAIKSTMNEGKLVDFEYRILIENSVKLLHAKSMISKYNKKNFPVEVRGIVQDITKTRQLQNQLRKYSQYLEDIIKERTKKLRTVERLAAIGETAGMVGHDLRNPLQTIIGEVFLAKGELSSLPDSEHKKYLQESIQTITEQISYMDKIVSDLQTFVKPFEPIMQIVKIKPLTVALLTQINIPSNIQTTLDIDNITVIADPQLLKRVLINIITNAIQAMPNGGEVTIKTEAPTQSQTHIIIEDTGMGIPDEIKPKIFMPLFTTKSKGQGFGLAVCKRVIEAQGGTISFESQLGKGTKFKISLPTQKDKPIVAPQ